MPLEPEFVRSIYDGDDSAEYSEDFRERYGTAAVFDRAQLFQTEFLRTRLDVSQVDESWNSAQEYLQMLDAQANEEGLLGRVATLRGPGIELPKFESDLTTNVGMISVPEVADITDTTLERYYIADEVYGRFAGFTLLFEKIDEEVYRPTLAYQVATAIADTAHAHINLYTTGVFGRSQLVFKDDEKKDTIAPLLETLYTLGPERADSVSAISSALLSLEQYEGSTFRRIGFHSEKLINAVDSNTQTQAEDAGIDLFEMHVETGSDMTIRTSEYLLSPEDTGGEVALYQDDDLFIITGRIARFVFLQHMSEQNGKVTYRDRRRLYAVMPHGDQYIYIPLTRIEEFSRV